MEVIVKVFFRVFRILKYRAEVYGNVGKGNKFTRSVYISTLSVIGKNNYFGPYTMINNATIGNYCSIAPGVKIGQGEHSMNFITTYNKISSKLINFSMYDKPAIIGNDVWIGANVVIKQGVKIGDGAVIGAGSIVTKDIPDYAIAVGVPAKVVRYRFNENKIEEIKKSEWWSYDLNEAKDIMKKMI